MRHKWIIIAVLVGLVLSGAHKPALASPTQTTQNLIYAGLGLTVTPLVAYFLYKNSAAQRAKRYEENLGLGEWYVGAYAGLSYLPPQDWTFTKPIPGTGPINRIDGRIAKNVTYQPGPLGGMKLGRFFDCLPWFGVEFEANFSGHAIRPQRVQISPSRPQGPNNLVFPTDQFIDCVFQTIFMARYGFLKDKEVPFGRLQPYVGLGPSFDDIFGRKDAFKNFGIATQVGLRYMFNPRFALFCEYKFSYQFKVEYQNFFIPKQIPNSTMTFDVPHHRFALGISYHFKNLFGN